MGKAVLMIQADVHYRDGLFALPRLNSWFCIISSSAYIISMRCIARSNQSHPSEHRAKHIPA